jgi:hypothetical protein
VSDVKAAGRIWGAMRVLIFPPPPFRLREHSVSMEGPTFALSAFRKTA